MLRAIWNGAVLAESDDIVMVEGNAYFPRESLKKEYLEESRHHSLCPWKGVASYLDIVAFGEGNENAAWYYPHPFPLARKIKGRVAFWNGVQIQEDDRADVRDEARAIPTALPAAAIRAASRVVCPVPQPMSST